MTFLRALTLASLLALPGPVLAQGLVDSTVNSVGNPLPFLLPTGSCTAGAACGFVNIAYGIVLRYRPLLTGVAVLVLVIFGYRMIVSQEDDAIEKAKGIMSGTLAGLVLVYLMDPFIAAFYGQTGEIARGGMAIGAAIATNELSGLINWVTVIAASLSMLMIILTGMKALGKSTSDETIGSVRKTVLSIGAGILLISFHAIISQGFVNTQAGPSLPFLEPAIRVVSVVMSFLALAAVLVLLYAGFSCVLSVGNEENYTKAKGILGRVMIGALVIIVSWALVFFVIQPLAR